MSRNSFFHFIALYNPSLYLPLISLENHLFFFFSSSLLLIFFLMIIKLIEGEARTAVIPWGENSCCSREFQSLLSLPALRILVCPTSFLSKAGSPPLGDPQSNSPDHSDSQCVLLLERYYRWPLCIQTLFGELRINIWASWHIQLLDLGQIVPIMSLEEGGR